MIMEFDFSKITVEELMFELGKGGHKPGSGSAAALQGMISAKLAQTVISVTKTKKFRDKYLGVIPDLTVRYEEIENIIFPNLVNFFKEDAYYFDKYIQAMHEYEKSQLAGDFYETSRRRKEMAESMKMAVRIPLEIAEHCVKLADTALLAFKFGCKEVRGDSHVSLGGAIASLAGCLSIVQLNFLTFCIVHFYWTTEMSTWYNKLKNDYARLKDEIDICIGILEKEVADRMTLYSEVTSFLEISKTDTQWSDEEIEKLASDFLNMLWKHHQTIWKTELTDSRQVLDPQTIFEEIFDYDFGMLPKLDDNDDGSECAGYIDQRERHIVLSGNYKNVVQNFTAAHELGHALLHNQHILHRDIPLDGSHTIPRLPEERQADKFATYFLMPKKKVVNSFIKQFGKSKLSIDNDTAFNLLRVSTSELREKCKSLREFTILVASAEIYAGKPFKSLAQEYRVSVTAMARRLEELQLVEY
ncbi:cyclodeaminase/cyclohydrolase family protein [Flavobacterium sp. UBA7682]|uniref:cyclodeaminase/cyclohydrolase family protein n=1 Tax=Flavobacterium sp. UBA7682 TaxID=1946560 RepID=UPI0025BD1010|nr:cyclodeaminase/cyclohydrolase family protein [Flavobacterium sp. UBA7682]